MGRPLNHRLLVQLAPQAHLPGGTTKASTVSKQKGSASYIVTNSDGTGLVKLVTTNSPAAGEGYLVATDANGSTYWVTKLTAHVARLTRRSLSGSYAFDTGARARWTLGSAVEGIVSIAHV